MSLNITLTRNFMFNVLCEIAECYDKVSNEVTGYLSCIIPCIVLQYFGEIRCEPYSIIDTFSKFKAIQTHV